MVIAKEKKRFEVDFRKQFAKPIMVGGAVYLAVVLIALILCCMFAPAFVQLLSIILQLIWLAYSCFLFLKLYILQLLELAMEYKNENNLASGIIAIFCGCILLLSFVLIFQKTMLIFYNLEFSTTTVNALIVSLFTTSMTALYCRHATITKQSQKPKQKDEKSLINNDIIIHNHNQITINVVVDLKIEPQTTIIKNATMRNRS